jgi:hypothetical protein
MRLLTALLLLVPLSAAHADGCDTVNFLRGSRTSSSIHSDSDDDYSVIDFTKVTDDRCSSATIVGKLQYSPAEDDILSMPFGAHAVFRERTSAWDRAVSLSRGTDGQIVRSYQFNRQNAPYDADAQRWFASLLPRVLMETGVNVKPRVARWRSQGGVDNVLSNIATIGSGGSKRAHYEALLDDGRLSDDDLDHVIRSASDNLRSSSGDLRAVLTRAVPNFRLSKRSAAALEAALIGMASSGDKTLVAQMYGQTGDRDMLLAMMRVAQTIASSGDRARLLQVLAPRYLSDKDRELQNAYFAVAQQIPSSGDMRNVLHIAVPYAVGSPDIAQGIIETARAIASSGDRSAVLISLVSSGAVQTKELRDAFFGAAAEIPSEGDRSRVLQAAARH